MNLPGTQSRGPWRSLASSLFGVLRPSHILALAFVVRLAMFLSVGSWRPDVSGNILLKSDAGLYHMLSAHLAHTGEFYPEPIRTPGYLCYVAGFYTLFGDHPWTVILSQVLLDVFICYLCYRFAEHIVGREGGLLAALFYAIDPTAILNANMLMSDTLFTFLLLAAVLAVCRAFRRNAEDGVVGAHLQATLLLGLAVLTRPVVLYFVPLYLLGILWSLRHRLWAGCATSAAAAALFCILLAPWVYRNYQEFGVIGVSSSGPLNLFHLYAVPTESLRSGVPRDEAIDNIYELTRFDKRTLALAGNAYREHQMLSRVAKKYLLEHPDWFARATVYGAAQMYANAGSGSYALLLGLQTGRTDIKDAAAIYGVMGGIGRMIAEKGTAETGILLLTSLVHLLQYGFFIFGCAMLGRGLKQPKYLFLLGFIILYSVMIGAAGWMRFKLPIVPFYVMFAGAGCASLMLRDSLKQAFATADGRSLVLRRAVESRNRTL